MKTMGLFLILILVLSSSRAAHYRLPADSGWVATAR